MIKRFMSLLTLLLVVQVIAAQIPTGYYNSAKGKKGSHLKTAFYAVIKDHHVCSYSSLMDHFKKTDRRPDGKVWDMYSATTNYSFNGKSLLYSGEGAGYNREHSFPKSWFGGKVTPMYTDLFHIYPTDGYINNRRWHYAFGENDGEEYTSEKGWSKLGVSTTAGCSDVVFEPNDEYKGDFARSYFYMATCYEDKIAGWKTLNNKPDGEKVPMLNQTSYPCFQQWALDMLLRWAKNDPVSQKEIDRNNAVYEIQGNRNPYIDFPGLEEYIWGNKVNEEFDPDDFESNGGGEVTPKPDENQIAAPVFSISSGEVMKGTEVTISCTEPGASIVYQMNEGDEITGPSPVTFEVNENVSVSAYATVGDKVSNHVFASYTVYEEPVVGEGVYAMVNNVSDLLVGQKYLIVCESANTAMSAANGDIRSEANVKIVSHSIDTDVSRKGLPYAFVLGKDDMGYTFYDSADKTYLALTSNNNKLHSVTSNSEENAHWTISISNTESSIVNVALPGRQIYYNMSSPRFATYTHNMSPVVLYRETVASAIDCPLVENGKVNVYDLNGRLLRLQVEKEKALLGLPCGGYIVGGTKVIVR